MSRVRLAFAHGGTALTLGSLHVLEGNARYLHVQVDAVHQGAGDPAAVSHDLIRGAPGPPGRVAQPVTLAPFRCIFAI